MPKNITTKEIAGSMKYFFIDRSSPESKITRKADDLEL
jgi:hypothetical protein